VLNHIESTGMLVRGCRKPIAGGANVLLIHLFVVFCCLMVLCAVIRPDLIPIIKYQFMVLVYYGWGAVGIEHGQPKYHRVMLAMIF
jgi:hypothetical protein